MVLGGYRYGLFSDGDRTMGGAGNAECGRIYTPCMSYIFPMYSYRVLSNHEAGRGRILKGSTWAPQVGKIIAQHTPKKAQKAIILHNYFSGSGSLQGPLLRFRVRLGEGITQLALVRLKLSSKPVAGKRTYRPRPRMCFSQGLSSPVGNL